jgi:uncharacterized protein (DUF1810 family)
MPDLERFKLAQRSAAAGYATALAEIRGGRKRGHWIWYVLPQIQGLGASPYSRKFGITDPDEAVAYLRDPELRAHLLEIVQAIAARLSAGSHGSLPVLMGSEIDAIKTVSSLTLFRVIAERLARGGEEPIYAEIARVADQVLSFARAEGYPPCERTIRWLEDGGAHGR